MKIFKNQKNTKDHTTDLFKALLEFLYNHEPTNNWSYTLHTISGLSYSNFLLSLTIQCFLLFKIENWISITQPFDLRAACSAPSAWKALTSDSKVWFLHALISGSKVWFLQAPASDSKVWFLRSQASSISSNVILLRGYP